MLRSLRAPNRSRMISAQSARAARNFATSSKKSLLTLKKKLNRGAKSSTRRPESSAACTYAIPLQSVNAISCGAVAPASRMWYPLIAIVFQCGRRCAQYANASVTSRIDGRGG